MNHTHAGKTNTTLRSAICRAKVCETMWLCVGVSSACAPRDKHSLQKTTAAVTPMKPKKAALLGQASTTAVRLMMDVLILLLSLITTGRIHQCGCTQMPPLLGSGCSSVDLAIRPTNKFSSMHGFLPGLAAQRVPDPPPEQHGGAGQVWWTAQNAQAHPLYEYTRTHRRTAQDLRVERFDTRRVRVLCEARHVLGTLVLL